MTTMIVTGGAGFIGANYIHYVLSRTDAHLVIVDKLTYAGNLESLAGVIGTQRVKFIFSLSLSLCPCLVHCQIVCPSSGRSRNF